MLPDTNQDILTILYTNDLHSHFGAMKRIASMVNGFREQENGALSKMKQIGEEIAAKWPGTLCAISHRISKVDIAEISVIIAVSTPHRDDSYAASRYAIERLKQIVPIWKKEVWEDGTEWKGHGQGPWNPAAPGQISQL